MVPLRCRNIVQAIVPHNEPATGCRLESQGLCDGSVVVDECIVDLLHVVWLAQFPSKPLVWMVQSIVGRSGGGLWYDRDDGCVVVLFHRTRSLQDRVEAGTGYCPGDY